MEDVFVKMADCGSGNVGTCISSLFIMKYNCLDNLSHNVFNNKNNNLNDAKCLTLDKKRYFGSSHKLDVTEDCVLNACKNLHESSDSVICSSPSDSASEDSDNYKKKRCMDRYDSSESSDSGVLTGSTCSESSSNSGTSDITDPCSPYSVASFHLGDDSGLSSSLQSKSSTFSNSEELLVTSKMLPENSPTGEENEVSCWEWDKTIDWNDRYELTSDDIDVEVKNADFFGVIEEKSSGDENDENNTDVRSNCFSQNQENKKIINNKLNFNIPLNVNLVERKSLNTIDNHFDGTNLSRSLGKTVAGLPFSGESVNLKNLNDSDAYVLPSVLEINDTKSFFYDKVFQPKRTACSVDDFQVPIFDDESSMKSENCPERTFDSDKCAITATKTNSATNKFVVNKSYPLDFFNILPSVFKNPNLHSADDDDDVGDEDDDDCEEFENEDSVFDDDCLLSSMFSSNKSIEKDLCCKSNLETLPETISNVSSKNMIIINNNNNNHNNNLVLSSDCLVKSSKTTHNKMLEADRGNGTERISDTISVYKKNIRFPTDRKQSFLSERICRWSDCVDHISSSTKLIEHLQTKHVNPQTFSETFICLWDKCKVFGRPSCSRTWLERHVLSHGGNKPYRCIVDNCGQRFSSQLMLERHINQHFKTPKDYSDGVADTTPKLIRRNGQKLRYRRQPYSVRSRTDGFDAGIMSQLQYLLVEMAHRSKSVSLNVMDSRNFLHVTFQPKVIGSRRETNGNVKYLIRWYPYNALEDEWLPKSEVENTRNVPIWKLPTSVQQLFWDSVFPKQHPTVRRSRKYKPESSDTR